jgi:hypothetical protein
MTFSYGTEDTHRWVSPSLRTGRLGGQKVRGIIGECPRMKEGTMECDWRVHSKRGPITREEGGLRTGGCDRSNCHEATADKR